MSTSYSPDGSNAIKVIQTHYAGHHFRSRLEARWAVFFDALGVTWQYEPEGIQVSHRLTQRAGAFNYLPDFFLPDYDVWAEVKGSLTRDEAIRLCDAAAALSSNDGGGCHDSGGNDLVVFGPIPPLDSDRMPVQLHMHKGDLLATRWDYFRPDANKHHNEQVLVAQDVGGDGVLQLSDGQAVRLLLKGMWGAPFRVELLNAYTAARKARFEHGQSG